jgi:hypothetical protein
MPRRYREAIAPNPPTARPTLDRPCRSALHVVS